MPNPSRAEAQRLADREQLATNKFDAVSSFFMAVILFLGVFVFMMFIIWLGLRQPTPVMAFPIIEENPAGRGDNAEGFERDFEPPGAEEVEELLEPTLADTIEAVTDAVSSVAASLTTLDTSATASTSGTGMGDSRPPGPEGEGDDIIPRFERWKLQFSAKDAAGYAKQLDFYNFELGAIGGSGPSGVDFVSNLSKGNKKRFDNKPSADERIYFIFPPGNPLANLTKQLLGKAGVAVGGKRVEMLFMDKNIENMLANIEKTYFEKAGHQTIGEVAQTVFESTPDGNGYKFEVIEQRYRKPRK